MIRLGHTPTQMPHAVHFSSFTSGSPSAFIRSAPNGQAAAHEPMPRHPHSHALLPAPMRSAETQSRTPL
mgnify:CR=1 FL=1